MLIFLSLNNDRFIVNVSVEDAYFLFYKITKTHMSIAFSSDSGGQIYLWSLSKVNQHTNIILRKGTIGDVNDHEMQNEAPGNLWSF